MMCFSNWFIWYFVKMILISYVTHYEHNLEWAKKQVRKMNKSFHNFHTK